MSSWGGLLANGLWLLGLALLLATWSLAYDEGQRFERRVGRRDVLLRPHRGKSAFRTRIRHSLCVLDDLA
jgi:hypothetical protein